MKKILIVDDEKSIRIAARTYFKGRNYEVLEASSGKKALKIIEKEKPDIVLLDVVIPKIDGFEICRKIKSDKKTKNTVVIIFSGKISEIEKGFDYGADDCLLKPLDWNNLAERVEMLKGQKRAE